MQLLPTGIADLDGILGGGLYEGGVYIVEGPPGSGKTILGLQFIVEGARKYNQSGLIFSFEETPQQLIFQAKSLGFDIEPLLAAESIKIFHLAPDVFHAQDEAEDIIGTTTRQINAKRIFIDSISHYENFITDRLHLRKVIYNLKHKLNKYKLTSILSKELSENRPDIEYYADGILRLTNLETIANKRYRAIEVLKARGMDYLSGKHTFLIGRDGISIYPLLPLTAIEPKLSFADKPKVSLGIEGLDELLGGGIPESSSLLLLGQSNSGRTTFSLHYIIHVVRDLRSRGVYFSFRLLPAEVLDKVEQLGWYIDDLLEGGYLKVIYSVPLSLRVDEQILFMINTIKEEGAKHAVIDDLPQLISPLKDTMHIKEKLFQLLHLLKREECTVMLISDSIGNQPRDNFDTQQLCDSTFFLKALGGTGVSERYLDIVKVAGLPQLKGTYVLSFRKAKLQLLHTTPK